MLICFGTLVFFLLLHFEANAYITGYMQERLYFFAVVPPEPLYSEVRAMKEEIRDLFGCSWALRSPAHITLYMPFRRQESEEEQLIASVRRFAAGFGRFRLSLEGFDCFRPRVLFLHVAPSEALRQLQASLCAHLKEAHGIYDRRMERPFHPHMTLAHRDVSPACFEEMWDYYKDKPFHAGFEVKGFYLLKHEHKRWKEHVFFPFSGSA